MIGPTGLTAKLARSEQANLFLKAIAECGRRFFFHRDHVSRFEVDARGRIWFVDSYQDARIYTHYEGEWRGFSEGGTLRSLVTHLRDFIRTGEPQKLALGPWPDWVCGGDLWGYGEAMEHVRQAATSLSIAACDEDQAQGQKG